MKYGYNLKFKNDKRCVSIQKEFYVVSKNVENRIS